MFQLTSRRRLRPASETPSTGPARAMRSRHRHPPPSWPPPEVPASTEVRPLPTPLLPRTSSHRSTTSPRRKRTPWPTGCPERMSCSRCCRAVMVVDVSTGGKPRKNLEDVFTCRWVFFVCFSLCQLLRRGRAETDLWALMFVRV